MDFKNVFGTHTVPKVIDPGFENVQPSTTLPPSVTSQQFVVPVTSKTIINDGIVMAQQVQVSAAAAISDIVSVNKSDSNFMAYVQLSAAAYPNPNLVNPSSITPFTDQAALDAAERDVLRRSVDPRAASVQNLYSIAAEAGLTQYTLTNGWSNFLGGNALLDQSDGGRLAGIALNSQNQQLSVLQSQVNTIQANGFASLAPDFISGFVSQLYNKYYQIPSVNTSGVDTLVKYLTGIRVALNILLIGEMTQSWEKLATMIKNGVGNILNNLVQNMIHAQNIAASNQLQAWSTNLLSGIEKLPNVSNNALIQLLEFRQQTNYAVYGQMTVAEDGMLKAVRDSINKEIARNQANQLSQKISQTKQYIAIINAAISYLQTFKSTVTSNQNLAQADFNKMTNSLNYTLSNYSKSVFVSPPKPIPELGTLSTPIV